MFKKATTILIIIFVLIFASKTMYAQEHMQPKTFNGLITQVAKEADKSKTIIVRLKDNETAEVKISQNEPNYNVDYKEGDKVILQKLTLGDGTEKYVITDFNRLGHLAFLFIVFALMSVAVGKKYGIYSLVGMALSFLTIFKIILPSISKGANPVLITILASFIIVPVTFYLSHGLNKKTHVAVIATFISLIVTSIFAAISVNAANLTGLSSDEAMFLQLGQESINMRGILLSGIIIGFLGVMDDVTVSQASIVMKLKKANKSLNSTQLYSNAMDVGRDHITSMINTLILVYAGASMPLLLLFTKSSVSALNVLNIELIADEVVRTLVGSIGLILSVPVSTFLASIVASED